MLAAARARTLAPTQSATKDAGEKVGSLFASYAEDTSCDTIGPEGEGAESPSWDSACWPAS